jgi:hypothetical protein
MIGTTRFLLAENVHESKSNCDIFNCRFRENVSSDWRSENSENWVSIEEQIFVTEGFRGLIFPWQLQCQIVFGI